MIPEWQDLVIWGHEHECIIEPSESLIGTFRITQPGSTVATSLCLGEAVKKQGGLLEIRGDNFRLTPNLISKVRGFAMDEISLTGQGLDAEDPKIDQKITKLLSKKVEELIETARENAEETREECEVQRQMLGDEVADYTPKYELTKPELVLVRLKVEHSGFSTLNNQRCVCGVMVIHSHTIIA